MAHHPPRVFVCASAVGYYGDRGDEELDERSSPGTDFLATLCREWEAEARRAETHGVRVVHARFGVILELGGGALAKMLPPFRMGLGGRLASGRQWMPWVHLDDAVGLLLHAASREELRGPLNVVAPGLVRNSDFTRELARSLHRPALFPVPKLALRLLLGEGADALLGSQRVLPAVAHGSGYSFQYNELGAAFSHIFAPTGE
jgi:uncharacterized protein